jgi:hypothetical protein
MASVGGEIPPEKKGRPKWLIIVLGIIVAFLLCCCGLLIYASTDSGEEFFNDLGTEVSERATQESD